MTPTSKGYKRNTKEGERSLRHPCLGIGRSQQQIFFFSWQTLENSHDLTQVLFDFNGVSWVFNVQLLYFLIKTCICMNPYYVLFFFLGSHGCYIFCTEPQDISASAGACGSFQFSSATEYEKTHIHRLIDPLGQLSRHKQRGNPASGSILPDLWSKGIYGFLLHYLNSVKVLFLKRKKKSTGSYCVCFTGCIC